MEGNGGVAGAAVGSFEAAEEDGVRDEMRRVRAGLRSGAEDEEEEEERETTAPIIFFFYF